ncbi:MAG: hypothetical protein ACOY4I_18035 [Bacillota bacterium]
MNRQDFNNRVAEVMDLSHQNPVLLNMLTLITHYTQCGYVAIFKVMAGPLAGRIIGEVVDGSMDNGLRVWVYEGLTYMIYSDNGPVKVE